MLSSKVHLSRWQSIGGKLLEENVFLSDTALPFLDSRYLNGLMTTFYTYLHPTPNRLADGGRPCSARRPPTLNSLSGSCTSRSTRFQCPQRVNSVPSGPKRRVRPVGAPAAFSRTRPTAARAISRTGQRSSKRAKPWPAGGGVDAEKPAPEDRSGQSLSTGTNRLQRVCSAAT